MKHRGFWVEEERVAKLKKMWPTKSAALIAAELGCTRNAIVGKAHRLGLKQPYHWPLKDCAGRLA